MAISSATTAGMQARPTMRKNVQFSHEDSTGEPNMGFRGDGSLLGNVHENTGFGFVGEIDINALLADLERERAARLRA